MVTATASRRKRRIGRTRKEAAGGCLLDDLHCMAQGRAGQPLKRYAESTSFLSLCEQCIISTHDLVVDLFYLHEWGGRPGRKLRRGGGELKGGSIGHAFASECKLHGGYFVRMPALELFESNGVGRMIFTDDIVAVQFDGTSGLNGQEIAIVSSSRPMLTGRLLDEPLELSRGWGFRLGRHFFSAKLVRDLFLQVDA